MEYRKKIKFFGDLKWEEKNKINKYFKYLFFWITQKVINLFYIHNMLYPAVWSLFDGMLLSFILCTNLKNKKTQKNV